jgi:branched-chain amino acid transport system substrate-binding protein
MLILMTVGCRGEPEQVQFGAILSMEGSAAAYGNAIWKGAELAAELVNERGGVDVEGGGTFVPLIVHLRDCQSDPLLGILQAQELIELGVQAVIGSDSSDVTLRMAPIFEEAEVVLMSPSSSSPKITDAGEYIYRNFPSDSLEAVNLANHMYNVDGIHEAAIIASQSEFGLGTKNSFIARFRTLGGTIIAEETFPPDAQDYSTQVEGVAAFDPPAVYIAAYSFRTGAVARALRDAGVDARLYGTGATRPENTVQTGGDAVEGLVFPAPAFEPNLDEEHMRVFISEFLARYGDTPDIYAAQGYDAVNILVQAVEQMGTRPENIRFYLNTMNPFEGVAGTTVFDDNGDVRKFHRMYVLQGGIAVPVGG